MKRSTLPSEKHLIFIKENTLIARIAAWQLHEKSVAVTIGRHIYLYQTSKADFIADTAWLCHEIAHVKQFEKYGFVRFLFMYIWESLLHGYDQNRWEIEARANEVEFNTAKDYIFI